ncbi:hypothetical protein L227DRAFT_556717 [Lentinus tigrinus ALCF2SS1-6]|uniref:RING-type E3 ubiquitin transferase n=1 Tax=Lentinus tigrinus ALCF2SS1-6 TaxID=1328759 RepID=A0A5C2RTB0_9APHY|nr:hypothetical protein L227DRAFT_556717 [Lentinus tigrinus ALCF2SS1-6]
MPIHDVLRQRMQPLTSAMTSNRIFLYCVLSTFAVVATIANACRAHSNFYSVSIYLSRSSRSVLLLANFGFLCSLLFGRVLQKLFFGTLQPREVERLYDQTWMFVTESLLAFTIFRDEFDVPFLLMFGFLLFVKCFHWLMADRVESMDQTTYPGPPTLFHVRMNCLFFVLWAVDSVMFAFAVESTLTNGVGGMVLFASEYAILLASALNAILRYILSLLDLRRARTRGGENAPPWENKSMYIFYIELLTDFLKLATYMTFFMIILTFYGLPLNIIRDVFVTARSFITRLRALVRYHNATRDMDRRYPDATEAELAEMSDRTCIICREEMQSRQAAAAGQPANGEAQQQQHDQQQPPADGPNMTPKKLPCGHIFHFQCLRSWLERQQSCPTCRRTVLENNTPQAQNRAPGQGQAPARPGAAPAPGGPQAQQGVAGAANPLGVLGRFFGLPPQPPAPNAQFPGAQGQQFAQGAVPPFQQQQQQPPQANPGWGAPMPGHVPPPPPQPFYDPMAGWQHHVPGQPMQPPQLQPPPMYRGFYGPGQAWQPWGDPRLYAPPPQQQPGQQQPGQPRPQDPSSAIPQTHEPGVSQTSTPTPTTSANTDTNTVDEGSEPSTRARSASPDERPNDPRAAAALAALRRRQVPSASAAPSISAAESSGRSTGVSGAAQPPSGEAVQPSTAPSVSLQSTSSTSSSSGSSSSETQPHPSASVQPAPDASTSSSAAAPSPPSMALPTLIPLYDPSIMQPTHAPGATPYYAPYNNYFRAPGARPLFPSQMTTPARGGQTRRAPRTPLSQLPPTLTDEELARLDRLTRDAIDERLRVLEGVSGAIYRCMEELTRVRSVLPASSSSSGTGRAAEASTSTSTAASGSGFAASEGEEGSGSSEEGELVDAPPREGSGSTAAVEVGQ